MQQAGVELKLGTLHCEVVKLRSGGKFETLTPTAGIGVVGTIFVIDAGPRSTRVGSIFGDVVVGNIDLKVLGAVTLHSGQSTIVELGKPLSAP
jgi:hypothetical protein